MIRSGCIAGVEVWALLLGQTARGSQHAGLVVAISYWSAGMIIADCAHRIATRFIQMKTKDGTGRGYIEAGVVYKALTDDFT